jgi:RES domain
MKVAGCSKLSLHPLTGYWFRAVNLKHWNSRLLSDQSRTSRSRFNSATYASPLYRILYLGENHQVSIYEVGALLGDPNAPISSPRGSWALMSLQVRLHHVADLSDPGHQKLIATNDQELTGTWANNSGTAPTQTLGAALSAHPGLEGFVFPSSKSGNRNLAIFMDKLDKRSLITFENELDGKIERLI